jgi:hypothetical protein
MHELYSAPAKGWENIYINFHRTGVGTYQSLQMPISFNSNSRNSEYQKACHPQWNGIPAHRQRCSWTIDHAKGTIKTA